LHSLLPMRLGEEPHEIRIQIVEASTRTSRRSLPIQLHIPSELTLANSWIGGLLDTIREPIEFLHKRSVLFGAEAADDPILNLVPARAGPG